jgi:hypothetical protein
MIDAVDYGLSRYLPRLKPVYPSLLDGVRLLATRDFNILFFFL